MYFFPADGWEKVIKIRCFSNKTAIHFNFFRICRVFQEKRKSKSFKNHGLKILKLLPLR
ncbi:MAG: hypothetical protein LBR79_06535 [Oscillospiraceae bacterium]|nr:hypothetical protein [Oscillospiraceae bacterium]